MNGSNRKPAQGILIWGIADDLNETIATFKKETSERVALIIIIFKY
jgi:hypothetical protein